MNTTTTARNATQLFSENTLQSHGEDVSPTAVITLCVIALILIVGVVAVTFKKTELYYDAVTFSVKTMGLCGCMLIAVIFFLLYAIMLHRRDQMDYQGLMRITDVEYTTRLQSTTSETCKPNYDNDSNSETCVTKTSYTLKLEAVYSLDWGYDWACPVDGSSQDQPAAAKQCRSRARTCEQTVCRRRTCSAKEHDRALQKASDCVFQQGVGFDEALAARGGYTPYDPLVGPSQDVDWPSLIAYGNCNTCDVALSVLNGSIASPTTIREVKTAGFVFLGAGAAVLVIALIVKFRRGLLSKLKERTKKFKSQNRFTYHQHQREPVLPVQEHPVPIELQSTPQPVQEDETIEEESKSSSSFAMVSARYIQILPPSHTSNPSSTTSISQLAPAKQSELPTSV